MNVNRRPRHLPQAGAALRATNSPAACAFEPLEHRTLLSASAAALDHAPAHAMAHHQAAAVHARPSGSPGGIAAATSEARSIGALAEFDPANFTSPTANPWFPLVPGTTYVYEAEEEEGLVRTRFIVTHETKQILGVTTTVVRELEEIYVEELDETFILEDTFDWYATDNDGNVWYFGEDTLSFEYDDEWMLLGTDDEGAWQAGVDGAQPGILIPAAPRPGLSYQQEFLEGEAEDEARVLRLNANVSIDLGEFSGVLVTKEWSKLEPGTVEHKYYAYGIGLIYVEELTGGRTVNVELVDIISP